MKKKYLLFLPLLLMLLVLVSCKSKDDNNQKNETVIIFNTDGGSEIESIKQYHDTDIEAPADPTKVGYTFIGWNPKLPEKMPAENMTITAQWEINEYAIIYDLDGGANNESNPDKYTIIDETIILKDPIKIGYEFNGWYSDAEYKNALTQIEKGSFGTKTFYAKFDINKYTVTFVDYDEAEIDVQTVEYGKDATVPEEPIRVGYTFVEWDKDFTNIKEDLVVKALYEINEYTVTFVDHDEAEIDVQTIEFGKDAEAPVSPDNKEGWHFVEWDKDFTNIKDDLIVKALYEINEYTVTFVDHDEAEIDVQTIEFGKDATAPEIPVRVGYTFTEWDKDFTNIKEDLVVKALYEINEYTVTFVDYDEAEIDVQTIEFGKDAEAPVSPDNKEGWHFVEWDKDFTNIKENLIVKAVYEINEYTVTFVDYDEAEIDVQTVEYGKDATVPEEPVRVGYTFVEWDKDFTNIKEDLIVKALYEINQYTVIFKGYEDEILDTQIVEYGKSATAPEIPVVEGKIFIEWNKDFTYVVEDLTVIAVFDDSKFDVKFVDFDDSQIGDTQIVKYKEDATLPDDPIRVGYTFTGWDADYKNITKDTIIKALYEINQYTITFDSSGGSVVPSITVDYEAEITAPNDPTKEGYLFDGWSPELPDVMPAENRTITAQWKAIKYDIVYHLDGGINNESNPDKYTIIDETIILNDPTKIGYEFIGWFDNEFYEGEPITKIFKGSIGNINLYASFKESLKFMDKEVTYDGNVHEILIVGDIPSGYYSTYDNNSHVNAGIYEVSFNLYADLTDELVLKLTATLTINKKVLDLSFNDLDIKYDGLTHNIEVEGEIPEDIFISYTGNDKTYPGKHKVTACLGTLHCVLGV